jgi:hypothetical protein
LGGHRVGSHILLLFHIYASITGKVDKTIAVSPPNPPSHPLIHLIHLIYLIRLIRHNCGQEVKKNMAGKADEVDEMADLGAYHNSYYCAIILVMIIMMGSNNGK